MLNSPALGLLLAAPLAVGLTVAIVIYAVAYRREAIR